MVLGGIKTGLKQHRLYTAIPHVTTDTGSYYLADENTW
jgi:hypothetical protein